MSISDGIDKTILSFFKEVEDKSTDYINKLIVSSFVRANHLEVVNDNFLLDYLIADNDENLDRLSQIIDQSSCLYGMEELVEVFEFVISPADKEVNGAVYTPRYIREAIIRLILVGYDPGCWHKMLYADLSCGCGGFFYTLIKIIKEYVPGLKISSFIAHNVLGVDIKEYSVERTKILLSLYALTEGEDLRKETFNVFCQNSLCNAFLQYGIVKQHGGIDVVIGNPPYVASSKMSEENRAYVKKWTVSKTGKSDLYLPFFQLGLESLKRGGSLGYITVNTFYRSLNGEAFRKYLSTLGLDCTIVDFGAEQLFKGCSTYTCICIIRDRRTGTIHYQETNSSALADIKAEQFVDIPYATLDDQKGWVLKDENTTANIRAIETTGKPLGDVVAIRNGFATLRNDIYIIKPKRSDKSFYYFEKDGTEHKVEKAICREAIKANIVRKTSDILRYREYIIFPYQRKDGTLKVVEEEVFKKKYPNAFNYLLSNKDELSKRDNGHKKYPKWYAFGRSQALNLNGNRLMFPHICDRPCFTYCDRDTMLFYDGYSIFADTPRKLAIVGKILSSDLFWYYISKTSKPYSGGFFSLEKRYIKHFGIPALTDEEVDELLAINDRGEIERWLRIKYGLEER